jgi:thymidylate synthase ThyX
MPTYLEEEFTPEEKSILDRYFTDLKSPVAALVNMPDSTKAALFARYSRTTKSLKRLFLDEFYDPTEENLVEGRTGKQKASELFRRVLAEYGDDSVAQLAGVHISCEQVSNILTKILERGRLMGYLEKSTRYVFYGDKQGGYYRYYRDPVLLKGPHGQKYVQAMDGLFKAYEQVFEKVRAMFDMEIPEEDKAARRASRAAALDVARGLLPAGTLSNLGIFGSAQAYEQMILRLRSNPLPEAREYAELILVEIKKVIPDFLTRLDRVERGGVWVDYQVERKQALEQSAKELLDPVIPLEQISQTRLLSWNDNAETEIVASALFPYSSLPLDVILEQVKKMSKAQKEEVFQKGVGTRLNRRHHPGREWEVADYEFEVISDYGAFRDLQRHRLLTIEWQRLSPELGYKIPDEVIKAGAGLIWAEAVAEAERAYMKIAKDSPSQASYLLTMQHRIRYVIKMNAREAMHLIELRSSPQGHAAYRKVAQDMQRLIRDVAGHTLVAEAMQFVNQEDVHLGRYEAEKRLNEPSE